MKKLLLIEDSLANKITYYHLMFFLISLPFDLFYSEVILISLTIHTALNIKKAQLNNLLNKHFFILSALYILSLVCSLYTNNKDEALFDLTKELAILLFP